MDRAWYWKAGFIAFVVGAVLVLRAIHRSIK